MRTPALVAVLLLGCSSAPTINVQVTGGLESDFLDVNPAVTSLAVHVVASDGSIDQTVSAPPGGSFDFGDIAGDALVGFDVTGTTADGTTVVRGRTVSGIQLGDLGDGVAIPIFAQRLGTLARPPGTLTRSHVGGVGGVVGERYLLLTGGTATDGDANDGFAEYYDALALDGASSGVALPRVAKTILTRVDGALIIDDEGATVLDFTSGGDDALDPPSGFSFADVAGGAAIDASDGRTFVVGGTRATGAPTDVVLIVETDGSLTPAKLTAKRLGATAIWIDGTGLIVAGGSATAAGVEVLGPSATTFAAKDVADDATTGAGASVTTSGALILFGGAGDAATPTVRTLDLGCSTSCTPEAASVDLGATLSTATAYSFDSDRFVVVGEDLSTVRSRAFVVDLDAKKVDELVFREPRHGVTTMPAPNGTLAILGGLHDDGTPALTVESFFPE